MIHDWIYCSPRNRNYRYNNSSAISKCVLLTDHYNIRWSFSLVRNIPTCPLICSDFRYRTVIPYLGIYVLDTICPVTFPRRAEWRHAIQLSRCPDTTNSVHKRSRTAVKWIIYQQLLASKKKISSAQSELYHGLKRTGPSMVTEISEIRSAELLNVSHIFKRSRNSFSNFFRENEFRISNSDKGLQRQRACTFQLHWGSRDTAPETARIYSLPCNKIR
jgi:hypothetical protein